MNLLRLIRLIDKKSLDRLMLGAAVSAFSTTAILVLVTFAAQKIDTTRQKFVDLPLAALFVVSVLIFVVSESKMIAQFAADIEKAIDHLRMKLIDRLRHADLWKLEHFGQSRLFGNITQSCKVISSNSQYLAMAAQSIILIVTILLYVATVSLLSFFLLTALLIVASRAYYKIGLSVEKCQTNLADDESKLFECVSDLLDGFKEQRLSTAHSSALGKEFCELSCHTVKARSELHRQNWEQFVFGETMFNLMLGLVVFVVPVYSPSVSKEVVKISAAILFMGAPIFGLMQSLSVLRAAKAAAGRMMAMEEELVSLEEEGSENQPEAVADTFAEIRMDAIQFSFPSLSGENPFSLGPLSLSIKRGEVIFITGGNGSGKSTFIKLLTGLYHPSQGTLLMDNQVISSAQLANYRALMAPVFSDFHLFSHLYGFNEVDTLKAEELLQWMEMEQVTAIKGKRFTRINLSTGQRKRLALVAALLEQKPILILDEWAADQDSLFRQKFYRELLPELRQRGLTIIAVTHDDRYFDTADRRFHLDEGQLTELPSNDRERS